MNRETYLEYLKAKNYNYLIYMFFIERSGCILPPEVFSKLFENYIEVVAIKNLLDSSSLLEVCRGIAIRHFDEKHHTIYCIRNEAIINIF